MAIRTVTRIHTAIQAAIVMTDGGASPSLLRLLSWLSPAFPVGAFAYSHGLERAIHDGVIHDRATLIDWLGMLVTQGSGWNDAVLLAQAWRCVSSGDDTADLVELAEAMAGSRERHMETTLQGQAFGEAVSAWDEQGTEVRSMPYAVTVASAAARHGISLPDALAAYLHAFTSNLIQAAVRLVPLGQRDGVATLAALEPVILETRQSAAFSTLDDLGSCTIYSDIMAMRHEIQYSRVFRS